MVRVGSTIEVFIDGISIGTETDSGTMTLNQIGLISVSNSFFDGVISDVKILDHTVSTSIPIRCYKIDEDLSITSTIIDTGMDGSNGTAISITESDEFCLSGCSWIGDSQTIIIADC